MENNKYAIGENELFKITGVKIKGHRGTWYNISEAHTFIINGKREQLYLFEHERYGDEAPHVIANSDGVPFMENVYNGWHDWREYVLEEQGYNNMYHNLIIDGCISV